jgi:hypothetical protein
LTAGAPWPSSSSTRLYTDLQALVNIAVASVPRFPHNHVLQHRNDVACKLASSPVPLRPPTTDAMADLIRAPRPPPAAIKGGLLSSIRAHPQLSLLTQPLLATLPRSISHRRPPIARSPPPTVAKARRRRRPPQTTQLLPDASSSTTTSRRTPPTTAGAPTTSSTPYLRLP